MCDFWWVLSFRMVDLWKAQIQCYLLGIAFFPLQQQTISPYCQTMSIKDFTILAKLGQGAYSTVYKVQRLADNQIYALKKVKLGNLSDKEAQNALNEVRILASIHHPNIVKYKEAFLQGKSLCIIMQFADDGDLYHKITQNKKKKKYFEQATIWKITINLLRGLKELHDLKILHRDLKTANVFLNTDGRAQLGDMNVSKIAQNGLLYTQTGTPYYASPEVWSQEPYDSKSDIWSLGCVIYQMTSLQVPFKAEDMEGLSKTVLTGKFSPIPNSFSKQLSQLINNMLQLKPKSRPNCDKMLRYPIVLRKIQQFGLNSTLSSSDVHNQLLSTIKMPRNLQYLTDRLPKSNYSFSKSYDLKKKIESSIHRQKKEERERTNTLPKLQKVIRYHESIIHNRKKKPVKQISNNNSSLLCVQGTSKNINDININLPNRRQKIQQQIDRIYMGKHAVNKRYDSKDIILPRIKK